MFNHRAIVLYFTCLFLGSCASSAQINGVKVIEENREKKYTQIRTSVFNRDASILKDTTNEFNRYPPVHAIRQYIVSLADIQLYEEALKNSVVPNDQYTQNINALFIDRFKKFNRQYSGYIDKSGDTILVVCFLDFGNKKKARKFFGNWKSQNGYLGSGLFLDSSPPHIYCYSLNLRTKKITRYKV